MFTASADNLKETTAVKSVEKLVAAKSEGQRAEKRLKKNRKAVTMAVEAEPHPQPTAEPSVQTLFRY
ncbi:hypothetical protein AAVH_21577 [Aphelenchoides avenae]|nr:hypothetical protein AAVH_21577 [Aphelenchus avenae]